MHKKRDAIKKQMLIMIMLVAGPAISAGANISQVQAKQQLTNTNLGHANIYHNEFGVIPSTNVNSSFTPPQFRRTTPYR